MENELGLDREKLIRMALLLGSDYTEGVSGIGIVNAIEVVNAFPEKDGLQKFREWVESPDPSILGGLDTQAGSSSSKRGCTVGDTNNFLESEGVEKLKQVFMNKHRNISKNWHIPSSFPSTAVISAYDSPQVDKSTEPFAWGKPDVSSLRKVCWEKFGWSSQKSDELLIPVLKEYNKHETQLRMEAFYTFNERFAKIRSKRIKKAVKHMTGSKSKDMDVENIEDPSNEEITMKRKSVGKQSRKRKGEQLQTEQLEPPEGASGGGKNTSKRSSGSRKGGPRETAQSAGKASKKSHSGFLKTSSEEERDSDIEQPSQIEELEKPNQTRRSERRRKTVNYTETKDDDTDKADPRNGDSTTEKLERSESQAADMGPTTEHHPTDSCKMNEIDVSNYLGPQRLSDFRTSADVDTGGAEMEYTVQPSFSETDDPPAEDILTKEYLEMGGGFCLEEEDGDDMEQEINASSPSREIGENETELDIDIVTDNASHKASEIQESTENNDDMSGSVFLRAMPNLRKRKKSS